MSGSPTFDTEKKIKKHGGANLKLRHTLRAGGVITDKVSTLNNVLLNKFLCYEKAKFR